MLESSSGTILVVDDTEANRYVLTRLLTRQGYRVIEAADGAETIKRLADNPDLIVLDVNLPDIKGTTLAKQIKSDKLTASMMILNMSATFTRTQDRIDALDHGADGFLTQPIDPPEFLSTVKSLLRIRRAEEEVRRANRDLALFAYTASHDLQEPLRMVTNYLGLLKRRTEAKLDEKERQYISFAVDGAQRMSRMVHDLLSLASADQVTLSAERIESAAIVGDAVDNLKLRITDTKASMEVAELPAILADRALLAQVFQNLISNGLKFQSERVPAITVTAERNGGFHVFRVSDNGIGIPADSLDRIFGIFQRLHGVDKYPGSGIGLSLCKRIVERHGGTIGVESVLGTGSTFWFTIPA
ncbi:MAG: response regulator [Planctomycetes bacterium]|nr:response regulator [Planctomycetota bacterium]